MIGLETSEVPCEVCDKTAGSMELFFGFYMHTGCAPSYWVKDRREMEEYMVEVRKRPLPPERRKR